MFWPFRKKRQSIEGSWQERLSPVVALMQRLEEAKGRMSYEEFDMFINTQGKLILSQTRKARIICGIASEEDIEIESILERSKGELKKMESSQRSHE